MTAPETMEAGGDAPRFFHLTPAVSAQDMLANMRSSLARGLPEVTPCKPHGLTLSVAGGGPSLADTYQEMDGYIAAVNGSLAFLLSRDTKPGASYACGILDAGEHIADMIVADKQVRYYVASICNPKVFDKLKDCDVRLWHVTPQSMQDPDGMTAILNEHSKNWMAIGGGCTMGLRWINLGYALGFRKFHLHGLDSSFRKGSTHAYPDRADTKDRVEFNGWETRPNFLAQLYDFFGVLNRMRGFDLDPIEIKVFGDGLLQEQYREYLAHKGPDKPLVCCVKTGTKYSAEYVLNLRDGVARNFKVPHEFVCFTDEPVPGVRCEPLPVDLPGWWSKISLFKLRRPLIYFDLDVVITGDLSPLLEWQGFGIIRDWWQSGFNSSVMKLTGDEYGVWETFTPDVMSRMPGDQDYISTRLPGASTFPPHYFPSFKANRCFDAPPADAMAVILHGNPKPHQLGGWVSDLWRSTTTKAA